MHCFRWAVARARRVATPIGRVAILGTGQFRSTFSNLWTRIKILRWLALCEMELVLGFTILLPLCCCFSLFHILLLWQFGIHRMA